MPFPYEAILFALAIVIAMLIIRTKNLFACAMLSGIFSLLCTGIYTLVDAVDVAFTEAAVGAGVSTVLFLATLSLTGEKEVVPRIRRSWTTVAIPLFTGAVLIYGTLDMPHFADPLAPIHTHVAPRYIEESGREIGVPNIVTSVLASYRGYDTLGETVVIFTAGLGVLTLLGWFGARPATSLEAPQMSHHVILRVITKALVPLILLYALYIQFHGDYGPGGGFQAGVIFAAAFILYAIIFGMDRVQQIVRPRVLHTVMAVGVLVYAGVGVVTMLLGGNYLGYNALAHEPTHGQHMGIFLVELGVGITVAGVMLSIFFDFNDRVRTRPGGVE